MARPQRRPNNEDSTPLFARIQTENHAKAARIAAALDVSVAKYLDTLLAHEELDEHGRPTWWPADARSQEELPLQQTA